MSSMQHHTVRTQRYLPRCISCVCLSAQLPYNNFPVVQYSTYVRNLILLSRWYMAPIFHLYWYFCVLCPVYDRMEYFTRSLRQYSHYMYEKERTEDLNRYSSCCIPVLREGMNMSGSREVLREIRMLFSDWGFQISKITTIPIMFYHGKLSDRIPIELVQQVAREMPHPSKLVVIEDAGDLFWMDEQHYHTIIDNLVTHFS